MSNKVALITGASQGIGQAIAKKLSSLGYQLTLFSRSEEKLEKVASEISTEVLIQAGDVSKPEDAEHAIETTISRFGKIDALINNAGMSGYAGPLENAPLENINQVIDINLKGAMYMMKYALPKMYQNKSGTILNVNSVVGKVVYPHWSVYEASKHGLRAVTQAVADEAREHNVRVLGIYPGTVETKIWDDIQMPMELDFSKMLRAEDIADAASYLLELPQNIEVADLTIKPLNPPL